MAAIEKNMDVSPSDASGVDTKKMYHNIVKDTGDHEFGSTESDVKDMNRMGKPQQFKVCCYGDPVENLY
jgi:hypothetical protein